MQQIKTAVAVFCIACISAELVAQLVGDTRGKQCIKAAAGLYILIAISNALPLLRAQSLDLALPQSRQQADFGSAEDLIVQEAQQKLETQLEAQILAQTGWPASLQLTLAQTGQGVEAVEAQVSLPPDCPGDTRAEIASELCSRLGLASVEFVAEEGGG
ncbi:hypothetical protein [Faecalibacterium gallinarum]|uniref:Stage III sporulation protein AF n=1 Tax=Faecalibacterium gallinarum TaxID=2903556 RepID=A0AA37IWG5_9FIRM|nr:hypothetical protein [Faecalibacterium gallinarum]GJN63746.1 hypothetical protein JCM17207_03710 [Faecalibacterium gallinarum]